jgi:hypothetical protein
MSDDERALRLFGVLIGAASGGLVGFAVGLVVGRLIR